jgi:hypothetical protein
MPAATAGMPEASVGPSYNSVRRGVLILNELFKRGRGNHESTKLRKHEWEDWKR